MTLIAWSGGCDSTLLLVNELEKRKRFIGPQRRLRTASFTVSPQIADKGQRRARKRLHKLLSEHYEPWDHISADFSFAGAIEPGANLSQPPIWISGLSSLARVDDEVQLGWVAEDCVWHYRQEVQWAWMYLNQISGKYGATLRFPLEWVNKRDVIKLLRGHELDLLDYTWHCEDNNRVKKPCGRCTCCLDHEAAIYRLDNMKKSRFAQKNRWVIGEL